MTASDGDRWIAAENITRAQAKLAQTKDEGERRALRDLIAREKEKLAVPKGEKRGRASQFRLQQAIQFAMG